MVLQEWMRFKNSVQKKQKLSLTTWLWRYNISLIWKSFFIFFKILGIHLLCNSFLKNLVVGPIGFVLFTFVGYLFTTSYVGCLNSWTIIESYRFHLFDLRILYALLKTWSDSKICLYTWGVLKAVVIVVQKH